MCIPLALAALYNFIHLYESDDADELEGDEDSNDGIGDDEDVEHDVGDEAGKDGGGGLHDRIVADMWADCLTVRDTHNMMDLDDNIGDNHL